MIAPKILLRICRAAGVAGSLLALSQVAAYCQLPRAESYLFVDVRDTAGQPITDAEIKVSGADNKPIATRSSFTNSSSLEILFPITKDHHYNLTVSKTGYLPTEEVLFPFRDYNLLLTEKMTRPGRGQPVEIILRRPPNSVPERESLDIEDRQKRLLLAVKRGDAVSLRKLLSAGASPNLTDKDGVPAIVWAAFAGEADAVNSLLAAGAKVREVNPLSLLIYLADGLPRQRNGNTLFVTAAATEQWDEAVRRLLKAGADANSSRSDTTVLNAALEAVGAGQLSSRAVDALLAARANVNTADKERRSTPLMWAAQSGRPEIVKKLIHAGAKIDAVDSSGRTPLMWAQVSLQYRGYHPGIVKALIGAGANVNAADREGTTPLMAAAKADLFESIKLLLAARADVNQTDNYRGTALFDLFQSQAFYRTPNPHPNPDSIKLLIDAGADVNARGYAFQSPLMAAVRANSLAGVKMLLEAGADTNARDSDGKTVLMYDHYYYPPPNTEIFKLLLAKGDPNIKDANGATPLMYAVDGAPQIFISLLLEAGAKASINAQDKYGKTALMRACYVYSPAAGGEVKAKLLIEAGADVNIKDRDGMTALSFAQSINRNPALIKLLEDAGRPRK